MMLNPQPYLTNQWKEGQLAFLLFGEPYNINQSTVQVVFKGKRMSHAEYISNSSIPEDNDISVKQGRRKQAIERYRDKMKGTGWLSTHQVAEIMGINYSGAHKTLTQTLCPLYLVEYKQENNVNYWRWL